MNRARLAWLAVVTASATALIVGLSAIFAGRPALPARPASPLSAARPAATQPAARPAAAQPAARSAAAQPAARSAVTQPAARSAATQSAARSAAVMPPPFTEEPAFGSLPLPPPRHLVL